MSNNVPMKDGKPMIALNELPDWECPYCKGKEFLHVYGVKKISSIVSPNGQAGAALYLMGIMCSGCKGSFTQQELHQMIINEKPILLV
jgi:hypothetical protein